MDMTKYLSNPAIGRIEQYLSDGKEHTTKEIAEYLSDIPVATLYRHINALIECGLVLVKEERKVRGSRERVLVNNEEWWNNKTLQELSSPYFLELLNRFQRYGQMYLPDEYQERFMEDRLFLWKMTLYLDDNEMDSLMEDLFALRAKYLKISEESKGKKGKLRDISLISAPTDFE